MKCGRRSDAGQKNVIPKYLPCFPEDTTNVFFFNISALLITVDFYYLDYFGLNKSAVDFFYTYFTVPKVHVSFNLNILNNDV